MSKRILVDCPMGNRCNAGGRHYQDSDIYRIHQEMAKRGGVPSGGTSQKEKYSSAANPMVDVSGDSYSVKDINYDESVLDNPALVALSAVAWTSYLKKKQSDKKVKVSFVESVRADEDSGEFTVDFRTGDTILFQKSEDNEGMFTAIRFDSDRNEVSREEVSPEDVEDHIKKNDKESIKRYAAGAAGAGAMSYAAASYTRDRRRRQAEKAAERAAASRSDAAWARHPALKWIADLFDNIIPSFR